MSVVSDVEIRLRADIARLRQDLQDARREVTGALNNMSAAAEAFKGVLGGIAAGLSVGAFAAFIKQSIDAADALNDMSVRTKVAIEDLAGLAYAAKLGDTSLDGVASSISKLGQNIGKEGAKFRELGITATEPLEAFKQLADVFKNIQDPQQRAAFGAEALGKSWQEAAVLLEGGSEGIAPLISRGQELSGITEQVAADAGAFNDKLDELSFAAQGAGTRIAAGLLPTLQKIADSFSANAVNGNAMENTVTVLSAALKGLYSVGVGVSALFVGLGKSIGGTAAVAVAALTGDFKGALQIYKEMATDVYTGLGDAAIQIGKVWVDTGKAVTDTADKTVAAVGNSSAKVAAFLNSSEIAGARDKAAAKAEAAAAKEKAAYAGLIASIKEKMAADQLEVDGAAAITPVQQARIKLDQELAAGKVILTKEHVDSAHALLDDARAMEKNAAAAKQVRAAVAALADERDKNYQSLVDEATANEELVRTYGKTKLEIAQMTLARDQDRLSQRGALELSEDTVAQLEREIDARKRSIAAMGSLDVLEKQKKATDEAAESQKAFWKSIDDTAHATFVSIANGSKDTAQRLKDTFKNVFFDWLYQQTIKKWIINIGTSSSGGVGDIANALGGGGSATSSGAGSLINIGKSIYDGFSTGFAGAGATLGGYVTTLGNLFGSSATSAFGAGMGLTSSQAANAAAAYNAAGMSSTGSAISAGSAAGAATGVFAGAAAGYLGGNLISGQYGSKNTVAAGTAIGAAIGSIVPVVGTALGALIGGLLGGVANRLFGMGEKKVQSTMLEGSLTATGATGNNISNWTQKGGWFRSDKKGTDTSAITAEQSAAFSTTYKAILDVSKVLGDTIGASTDALSTRVQKLSIDFTGLATDADKLGAVTKFFEGVADTIALEMVPNLRNFQKEGEALSVTMQRVVVDYAQVKDMLAVLGKSVGAVGAAGVTATEGLIKAAGGLDALAGGVSYFQQNFYTDAQKLEKAQTEVAAAMASVGFAGVKTTEQFKAATLGIDLTTQAGADLFVKMLALAPAFKTVADAAAQAEAAAKAQADAAIAAAQASAAAALERLKANEDILRNGVSAAYSALEAAVAAKKDVLASAYADTIKGIEKGIADINASGAIKRALSDALKNGLVSVSTPGSAAGSLQAAQAQIRAALVDAQRSGVLPSADSLKDALAAVGRDNSDQFSSLIEFQRSVAKTNADISALGGITDQQLTVQERQLIALNAQKDATTAAYQEQVARLDGVLAFQKMQADLALGQYQQLLSVNAGIATVGAAIAALKMGATTSNPTGTGLTIEGLYQSVLGRAPDAAGAAFWSNFFGDSIDANDYAEFIKGAQPELALPRNAWQTSPTYAPKVDDSTARMANMEAAMNRTAAATAQLADQFSKVSGNGNALLTEALV